ncbi:NAD(P)H-dependent oxidoreductase [Lactococcus piscium]|uniref:NAD(P)H-dependent oxidoreductase n=1 Tax=Pseudolactococcus carnosus TaxID=2749961 RepID=UPI001FBB2606|nr:NAD(P)H-dependent oxidoreductase [Lactococcus carnosus]MCJ1996983.1 NAD(P)H-dependent oxidoreductase [Lactococcus carnosus]
MKTLVLIAHPNLSTSRFNQTWKTALAHHDVTVHDLYASYPDGKIDTQKEQDLLVQHDRIVFQFPLYWYSTPALLKQWQDEVLTYGFAYGSKGTYLQGKELMLAISAGSSEADYQADGRKGFTMTEVLRPLEMMSQLCSLTYTPPFIAYGANEATDEEVKQSSQEMLAHILCD